MEKKNFSLAIAVVAASFVLGIFFYVSRPTNDTIRVTGLATKPFESDIIKWRLTIARNVGLNDISAGYEKLSDDLKALRGHFKKGNIPDSSVTLQPAVAMGNYGQGGIVGYNLTQSLYIISSDITTIEEMATNPAKFFSSGVLVQSSQLEYYSSHLSELKYELLAEATRDAQRRAEEIAKTANVTLKNIVSARAGVFQIREPYSTEVNDYGVYNSSTRKKEISVTMNAEYAIQ
ncbi:MAG: SIMPL domain-containing protein [Bacteroidetes bacterium]|nr:SIMPL domain-containing protein [Bacteroidota bacterium]